MVLYCNETRAGKNRKLLDIVSTKGPNGYNEFRVALEMDYQWLVEVLDQTPRSAAHNPTNKPSPTTG